MPVPPVVAAAASAAGATSAGVPPFFTEVSTGAVAVAGGGVCAKANIGSKVTSTANVLRINLIVVTLDFILGSSCDIDRGDDGDNSVGKSG